MNENIETVELFVDDMESNGITAFSFVNRPAMKSNFVALSEEKIELKAIDDDKRIVIGLAMIPNKLILRNKKGFLYNITFSEDTIRKASEKYLKSNDLHSANLEHSIGVEGVFLSETWIVEDTEKDKTAIYGIEAPVGSWAVAMRVENDDVWRDIKEGKFSGFSIEGMFKEKMLFSEEDLDTVQKINNLLTEYLDK